MTSVYCVVAISVLIQSVVAFPQNEMPSNEIFRVDGFVFDGPADRPSSRPFDLDSPRTVSTSTTTRPTSPTAATTSPANPDLQYNACVSACPVTPEYNPVCGTDNVNYNNPGSLNCAARCGKTVSLRHYGPCSSSIVRG